MTIPTYLSEIQDGLEHKIQSSASILIASQLEPSTDNILNEKIKTDFKSLASYNDKDLYYADSIMVTSSWNLNDDIFDPVELWMAKDTPEDKPTNLDHDESIIVGHIISNTPVTEDFKIIPKDINISDLPPKYHILTGSVIYKAFTNPELISRAKDLISSIENKNKYVSMECLFKNFDYGIMDAQGNYKVLSRNNSTAHLTKYLRAYGGNGNHQNYKIGRVLRNITFTGKGFVDKPANPESIIFSISPNIKTETEKNSEFVFSGVSISQSNLNVENQTMSLEIDVAEMKAKIDTLATAATTQATVDELQNKILSYEKTIETLNSEKSTLAGSAEEYQKKSEEEFKKVKSELESALETIAAYKGKEEEMMKKEKKMKRMASLTELGASTDEAEAASEKFDSLDDEAFSAMTTLLAAQKPDWLNKKKDKKDEAGDMKAKCSVENTKASVLDNAETTEDFVPSVGSDSENSAMASVRSELSAFMSSRFGKNSKTNSNNKGE